MVPHHVPHHVRETHLWDPSITPRNPTHSSPPRSMVLQPPQSPGHLVPGLGSHNGGPQLAQYHHGSHVEHKHLNCSPGSPRVIDGIPHPHPSLHCNRIPDHYGNRANNPIPSPPPPQQYLTRPVRLQQPGGGRGSPTRGYHGGNKDMENPEDSP